MIIAQVPLETVGIQLVNERITTPATVRFDKSSVDVEIVGGEREYHFEFALVGSQIRLVMREMTGQGVTISVVQLHDLNEPASDTVLKLTGLRQATER